MGAGEMACVKISAMKEASTPDIGTTAQIKDLVRSISGFVNISIPISEVSTKLKAMMISVYCRRFLYVRGMYRALLPQCRSLTLVLRV